MPMGFAIQPAHPSDGPHSRSSSSLASSGTAGTATSAASASASTRTSSISSVDGRASEDGNGGGGGGGGSRPGQSPARAPGHTLEAPSRKHRLGRSSSRPARLFQRLRSALPILITPRCGRMQVGSAGEIALAAASSSGAADSHLLSHVVSFSGSGRPCRRVTGTLFGHRKGRVALALQETPRCLPSLVVELALQTHALLRELGNPAGARIVLETERRAAAPDSAGQGAARKRGGARAAPLLDEAAWTMFCNGRKTGYAVRREATNDDLAVMETLRAVSMGAGVLPVGPSPTDAAAAAAGGRADGEVAYMRGCFDHFVGSRDSESLYMVAPQGGGTGPELAVFFVRL